MPGTQPSTVVPFPHRRQKPVLNDDDHFKIGYIETVRAVLQKPSEVVQAAHTLMVESGIETGLLNENERELLGKLRAKDLPTWAKLFVELMEMDRKLHTFFFNDFKRLSPLRSYAFTVMQKHVPGGPYTQGETIRFASVLKEDTRNWVHIDESYIYLAIPTVRIIRPRRFHRR